MMDVTTMEPVPIYAVVGKRTPIPENCYIQAAAAGGHELRIYNGGSLLATVPPGDTVMLYYLPHNGAIEGDTTVWCYRRARKTTGKIEP